MKPYNDSAAPTPDRGVLARLHRLDRDLFVTWSPWALDVLSGQPLHATPNTDPVTGVRPRAGQVADPHARQQQQVEGDRDLQAEDRLPVRRPHATGLCFFLRRQHDQSPEILRVFEGS